MPVVTAGHDPKLSDLLLEVYLHFGDPFEIHKVGEYTIYIQLYSYFVERYADTNRDTEENFMTAFLKEGLPAYYAFLDEVIALLDLFHLRYELIEGEKRTTINKAKGGFSCVM